MRILYLINHAGKAGTEKYVYNLVKAYNGIRAECFFAYNEEGQLRKQMNELNVPCFHFEMRNPYDLKAAKNLAKYCEENRIDIIHAQYPRENYIAVLSKLFRKKTKVIFTSHLTLKTNFLWKITNKLITSHNARIISVCNNGKKLLIANGVSADKIDVIFNGLAFSEEQNKESTIRQELQISEDTFVVTTLARYNVAKGLPFLVESVKALNPNMKIKVLIAGDGELWDEIKSLIVKEGLEDKILQLGFRSDVDNVLNGSDIFVNSAKCYEALSFAILEALGRGLPVIATNIGGNSDIVNEKNYCGFLVPYGDTAKMAQAIEKLAEDKNLYAKFSKNAVLAIKNVFNLDIILNEIYNVYVNVTGGK